MKHFMQDIADMLLDVFSRFKYVAFSIFMRRTTQTDRQIAAA